MNKPLERLITTDRGGRKRRRKTQNEVDREGDRVIKIAKFTDTCVSGGVELGTVKKNMLGITTNTARAKVIVGETVQEATTRSEG